MSFIIIVICEKQGKFKYMKTRIEMKKYGEVFREIRESRNLSLKHVVGDKMSIPQLSKFERGETDLTIAKFIYALEKVGMTLEEFEFVSQGYEFSAFDKMIKKMRKFMIEKNIYGLKRILQEQKEKKVAGEILDEMNYLMSKSVLSSFDEKYILVSEEKDRILDYLYSVDDWGYYQLILYGNVLPSLGMKSVFSLAKEVVSRSSFYKSITKNKQMVIQILLNTLIFAINKKEFTQAQLFKNIIEDFLDDETDVYEKTIFLFTQGALSYYTGKIKVGKQQMLDAIDIFGKVGSLNLARNYKDDFDEIIGENL